jgi:amino acid adenylation domain-containing protein/non-ribosomal peptide synthase protein (TIGR01720 family)
VNGSDLSPELVAKYGDRLASLSPAQRELLERALKKKEAEKAAAPAVAPASTAGRKIPRRQQPNFLPLSIDQERLWFVQQLDLDSPIYNIYSASRLKVPLDVPTLGRAVDEVVRRHEILRTTFPSIDGRPVMQIAPELKVGMPWIDLRALPVEHRRTEADRVANQAVGQTFDLLQLPLFRMWMVQVADADFIWPACLHHIITDWIAFYNFELEIRTTYSALLDGQAAPLPEPVIQYGDFTVWQRERMLTKDLDDQLNYWKELLKDASDLVSLPIDHPRPPVQSAVGGRQRVFIGKGPTENLRALAQKEGTTPFAVLLAVLKAHLARLSGEVKLIVGTPMSHRIEPETQNILGFFLSQLIYYSDYSGNPSFREAVRRERDASMAAYAHSEVPFSQVVEALRPERDLSRTPFFQIQLLLLNPGQVTKGAGGFDGGYVEDSGGSEGYWVDAQRTQSELAPIFWETVNGFHGFFEYNKAIFDITTIDRMKEQFRVLFAAACENPEVRLWELPLLPESQRHQLLVEWNELADLPADPGAGFVHADFEAQAAARPEAPAVVTEEGELSYGELDRRAGRLAHRLRQLGVGPEVAVLAAVERSPEAIVALLGVLKAGGVYVPVEVTTPADRVQFMLRDTGAPVVLVRHDLPWPLEGVHALRMSDEEGWEEGRGALSPAAVGLEPGHLAYVIYTSGSTGEPKGVGVPHGPAAAHFRMTAGFYGAVPGERLLQFSIFAFDASMEQIFSALSGGAAMVLRGEEIWDPSDLGGRLARLQVAVADLPTSYWGRWAQSLPAGEGAVATPLRLVSPAGEAMTTDAVRHWQAGAFREVPLLNGYGPTEAVVTATGFIVPPAYEERGVAGMVPIGRSLPGRVAYVMDAHLNPVPSGVAGELCLGGPLLARGYLHRPELSAQSFVPDPLPAERGARLYRTGDRVRLLPDGVIEFLGRIDFQVKVRGFRIELGEIESALQSHPSVGAAAVVARNAGGGNYRLAAYVVAEVGEEPQAAVLREALRLRLPEYMVPASFSVVDALPFLANGKVDRRALLARPEPVDEAAETDFAAPRTPVEKTLAAIWGEVLRRDKVGIHDNFFSLGGDSILSIQVIARAQRAGLQLSPRLLFQHQTIAELAEVAATAEAVAAEQGPVVGPVPLTPIERWYLDADPVDPHHFNMTMLFETAVALEPSRLAAALAAIEAHHDALRFHFHRGAEGWEQEGTPPEPRWPLAAVDLSALPEGAASRAVEAAAAAAQGSLDLERGPLYRALVFDLGAGKPGRLYWTVNHLVVDGVSWRILLEDLATAYAALEAGIIALPPKTTSYRQWAERLVGHAASPPIASEIAYWGALPWNRVEPLPIDLAGGGNRAASERTFSFVLEADETRDLLQEVHRAYNTRINDLLLAAFGRAIAAWTGSPMVLFDLEGHGREEIFPDVDLSRTVGWFTSIYPVLLDLSRSPSPADAIKNTKEQLRVIPGNGLGFGMLRFPPSGQARLADLPRAEIVFNYLGQIDQALPESTPFLFARESVGPLNGLRSRRPHLLSWNAAVTGGSLLVTCAYSDEVHRPDTIERLAHGYRDQLRQLIEHCKNPEAGGFTPSDFAGARLNQKDLDKFLGKLGRPGRK